ncbi:hypothetical protein AB6A40_004004 [Gnathostoma spinigerum]|uniref:Uncharacterized protein n=1 Tax=Gnathostoma spinigerum TaxID=75299 RepID=A0ABD6ELZ2_9BILA
MYSSRYKSNFDVSTNLKYVNLLLTSLHFIDDIISYIFFAYNTSAFELGINITWTYTKKGIGVRVMIRNICDIPVMSQQNIEPYGVEAAENVASTKAKRKN